MFARSDRCRSFFNSSSRPVEALLQLLDPRRHSLVWAGSFRRRALSDRLFGLGFKVLHLHTGTCQYLDRETGELMWLVDASDEKHWWTVASPNLYEAVYELGVLVGVEWED